MMGKMELKQESKTVLYDDRGKKLEFEYLPKLSFQTPELKKLLRKDSGVDPSHVALGKKWKKAIEAGDHPKVSIRWMDEKVGHGLFAEEDLPEGSYVGEYVGEVRRNDNRLFISDYLYAYPVCDEIGRNYVIDAFAGNIIRFVNHSYTPNLKPQYVFFDGYYHMILLAMTPIKKGTQLMYNYGKQYWYVRTPPKFL